MVVYYNEHYIRIMNLEIVRTLILAIGWPVLIIGSIFILRLALEFYRGVHKTPMGKLVLMMTVNQIISMYALALVATGLLRVNLETGVFLVLPVFLVWASILIATGIVSVRWGKEGIKINELNENLEVKIQERTNDLKRTNDELVLQRKKMESHTKELEKFNLLMVDRELKMIELKKEIKELKDRGGGDFLVTSEMK